MYCIYKRIHIHIRIHLLLMLLYVLIQINICSQLTISGSWFRAFLHWNQSDCADPLISDQRWSLQYNCVEVLLLITWPFCKIYTIYIYIYIYIRWYAERIWHCNKARVTQETMSKFCATSWTARVDTLTALIAKYKLT